MILVTLITMVHFGEFGRFCLWRVRYLTSGCKLHMSVEGVANS